MPDSDRTQLRPVGSPKAEHSEASIPALSLWHDWSLEATLPRGKDISALADSLEPNRRVYLSNLPRKSNATQIEAATALSRAGLEPVPHLAARKIHDQDELRDYLDAMQSEAGIQRLLVIAGDQSHPRGPYASSLDIISDEAFLRAGIREIGIAGYPEGHPLIGEDAVEEALAAKLDAALLAGIDVEIVTQFCFDAGAIVTWHEKLRSRGIVCPIRIGLAGPASAKTLLKLALRCGVNLPLRQTNVATRLLRGNSVDDIVPTLEASSVARDKWRTVSLHFYSFGGIPETARWAQTASPGRKHSQTTAQEARP